MTAIDSYGDFELPEEKSVIEVVEDPKKILVSNYHIYQGLAKRLLEGQDPLNVFYNVFDIQQKLYETAEKLFEEKEKLNVSGRDLLDVIKQEHNKVYFYSLSAEPYKKSLDVLTGSFLSAVHNNTALDILVIKQPIDVFSVGHKLKTKKTLILGKESFALDLGSKCEGNIINYADLNEHDEPTFGKYYLATFAFDAKKGIQINKNKASYFGYCAEGGIQINQGNVAVFGENCSFRAQIQIHDKQNYDASLSFSNGEIICLSTSEDKTDLHKKLGSLVAKLNFLDNIMNEDVATIEQKIRAFEWQKFEEEVTIVGEQIKKEQIRKREMKITRGLHYMDYY